jgi:hypothetical protein
VDDHEEQIWFIGPCTCDHDREEHGWGSCNGAASTSGTCVACGGWLPGEQSFSLTRMWKGE